MFDVYAIYHLIVAALYNRPNRRIDTPKAAISLDLMTVGTLARVFPTDRGTPIGGKAATEY